MLLPRLDRAALSLFCLFLFCAPNVSGQGACQNLIDGCSDWKEHCDKSNILYFCQKTCGCELCRPGMSSANVPDLCRIDCGVCNGGGGGKPGNWGRYGPWTRCPVTCGGGEQQRTRKCRGTPNSCAGDATQTRDCNTKQCPGGGPCIDLGLWCPNWESSCKTDNYVKENCPQTCGGCGGGGPSGWGEWANWSDCDVTCGTGSERRTRTCHGGDCAGQPPDTEVRSCSAAACEGGWAEWNNWGQCGVTCGGGMRERTRTCSTQNCPGLASETSTCSMAVCPVWGDWSDWGGCSVPCGTGSQDRYRSCLEGECDPQGAKETQQCSNDCTGPTEYGDWTEFGQCSQTCGGGIHSRTRTCLAGFGLCTKHSTEIKNCNEEDCTTNCKDNIDNCDAYKRFKQCSYPNVRFYCQVTCGACGEFGGGGGGGGQQPWSEYGPCSVTCGIGSKTRYRGFVSQVITCFGQDCGTGGGEIWSNWSAYGLCSATCGGGKQSRTRTCPTPGVCPGLDTGEIACETGPCPIPVWENWGGWGTCSTTCGPGKRTRQRKCSVPNECVGRAEGELECFLKNCKVAEWSNWSLWTDCSKTCGRGESGRSRTCSIPGSCAPPPAEETRFCNTHQCPVWEPWTAWNPCSKTCGSGNQVRNRVCSITGGCQGPDKQDRTCETRRCPGWDDWGNWGSCSLTCGGGTRSRKRKCTEPGKCVGGSSESEACNSQECPEWAQWSQWSACTVTCGIGKRSRARTCTVEGMCGGVPGRKRETENCMPKKCEAVWSEWGSWGDCSKTCDTGEATRTRTCSVPTECAGDEKGKKTCNTSPCVGSSWSKCSKSCGGGTRRRRRCDRGKKCVVQFEGCGEGSCAEVKCSVFSGVLRNRYTSKHECCTTTPLPASEECGRPRTGKRVIGGVPAKAKQWPWMAAVDMNGQGFCAGSIISHNFILSAAHCFAEDNGKPVSTKGWSIYVGLLKLTEAGKAPVLQIGVKKSYVNPNYNFPANDIALVELKHDISYTDTIQPICLPWGEETPHDSTCFVTGWGVSDVPDTTTNHLQELGILNVDPGVCVEGYGKHRDLEEYVPFLSSSKSYLCAGSLSKLIDSCKGDSGGPLVCQRCKSCTWYVAGVVSFGPNPCALRGVPAIYTKVVSYEDWIFKTTGIKKYSLTCSDP